MKMSENKCKVFRIFKKVMMDEVEELESVIKQSRAVPNVFERTRNPVVLSFQSTMY